MGSYKEKWKKQGILDYAKRNMEEALLNNKTKLRIGKEIARDILNKEPSGKIMIYGHETEIVDDWELFSG